MKKKFALLYNSLPHITCMYRAETIHTNAKDCCSKSNQCISCGNLDATFENVVIQNFQSTQNNITGKSHPRLRLLSTIGPSNQCLSLISLSKENFDEPSRFHQKNTQLRVAQFVASIHFN